MDMIEKVNIITVVREKEISEFKKLSALSSSAHPSALHKRLFLSSWQCSDVLQSAKAYKTPWSFTFQ